MNKPYLYITVDDDRLDLIAYRHYKRVRGTVEAILAANPQLSAQPMLLKSGLHITLPVLSAVDAGQVILWQ